MADGFGRRREAFDQGYQAFARSFPHVAAKLDYRPFYVCPLCLVAGSEKALDAGWLSQEDVPPKALGGKKIVLTCVRCNSRAGHEIDWHARREADLHAFLTRGEAKLRARLRTSSGRLPVTLNVSEAGIEMFGVPKAARKTDSDAVKADFDRAGLAGAWRDFRFNIEFAAFSQSRAAVSWLRSAYLVAFAALGYRFIYRPELNVIRERIKNPDLKQPHTFRIIQPNPVAEPTLLCIDEPDPFRSYAVLYRRNVIFLPRYGDTDLYARLAGHPECNVQLSGKTYPWPDRPLFLHDFVSRRAAP